MRDSGISAVSPGPHADDHRRPGGAHGADARGQRGGMARALDQHVHVRPAPRPAGPCARPVRSATASRCWFVSVTVTSVAPKATRDLRGELADRPRAGDQHAVARAHAALAARPDADRQGLHQRAHVVRQRVGQREGEVLVDGHEVRERAVDRRRGEEHHVGAEVVAAGAALGAAAAGDARLERHAVARAMAGHLRADLDDAPGGLVPEHHRRAHDEVADAAVLVVVDVRAAHADGGDLDEHLARPRLGHGPLLDPDVARRVQHGGAVRARSRHGGPPPRFCPVPYPRPPRPTPPVNFRRNRAGRAE